MTQPQHQPTQGQPKRPRPGLPNVGAEGPARTALTPQHVPTGAQPVPTSEPISPQPQRDTDPRRPVFVSFALPVSTTDSLPGSEIEAVLGVVVGVATRPRDMAHNPELAFFNTSARQDAIGAMVQQAQEVGADAVVGLRFDGGKVSESVSEITAYGTAVRLANGDDEITRSIRLS